MRRDRKDKSYQPDMPPLAGAGYLLDYLWEIGPAMVGGMDAGPLTQQELRAWQDNSGIDLQPWEVRFLRSLSCDYLAELHQAEKPDCPPPWRPAGYVGEISEVAKTMQARILELSKL